MTKLIDRLRTYKCDTGLISDLSRAENDVATKDVEEFYDVLCVADGKKPLAALNFSPAGRTKIRKRGKRTYVNQVIKEANRLGVVYFRKRGKASSYLNSVFFLPKNERNAVALMTILHESSPFQNDKFDVVLGTLLGYSTANILTFHRRNSYPMTKESVLKIQKELLKWSKTLDIENHPFHTSQTIELVSA